MDPAVLVHVFNPSTQADLNEVEASLDSKGCYTEKAYPKNKNNNKKTIWFLDSFMSS